MNDTAPVRARPALRLSLGFTAAALLCVLPRPAAAQQEAPATVSLDEAIQIALENNPAFRSQLNDVGVAEWDVREAYGSLLPGASASAGFQYQAEGSVRFGSLTGSDLGVSESPASYLSDYSVGFNYRLDGPSVARLGLRRAQLESVDASVRAAAVDLAAQVRTQYVATLRERDAASLAAREVELAQQNAQLARARVEIGAATRLEEMQAEVELGRARVELLTAENRMTTEELRLLSLMGVELERDIELSTEFQVFEPAWSADQLLQVALSRHPELASLAAQADAGRAGVRAARLTYLPSLDVSAGWSGYTRQVSDEESLIRSARDQFANQRQQCVLINDIFQRLDPPIRPEDCSQFVLTPQDEAMIRSGNDVFPFDYANQPFTARAQISLPIFQGFSRQAQIEEAKVVADDARYALRAQQLQIRAGVISSLRTLETAHRAVQLEERNVELAQEQLELSQERYRLGAISFLELTEATTLKARADRAYLVSVYAFHQALAALEAAVGRDLDELGDGQ